MRESGTGEQVGMGGGGQVKAERCWGYCRTSESGRAE